MALDNRQLSYYHPLMLPQSEYLTVNAAAKRIGVTTQAVRARIAAGKLTAVQAFEKIVVERAGVEAWEAERVQKHLTLNTGGL